MQNKISIIAKEKTSNNKSEKTINNNKIFTQQNLKFNNDK